MRSLVDPIPSDHLAVQLQRGHDARALVTVGRAAQMLRMSRRAVWNYVEAEELRGEWVEGAQVARGGRVNQLVFTKGEVRRFRELLEDRRRRRPSMRSTQLALPLEVPVTVLKPRSWRLAKFKPVMIRAGRAKLHDREPGRPAKSKDTSRVA